MLYPKIEDCIEKIGGKYAVAIVASKRSKDIVARVGEAVGDELKSLTQALKEISEGIVVATHASGDSGVPSTQAN